ncbi:MAG TPA: lanthionine synthetase LanC family protein [Candidatus Acidoferrales bacterium]|nr:lanthionine synthetase LanC family protein [Candidatus Acidoferrales bacterium]
MTKALSVATLFVALALLRFPVAAANHPYQAAAIGAERWIETNSIETKQGIVWAAEPGNAATISTDLFHGTPGPILFLLESYRYTGDQTALRQARRGADALLGSISKKDDTGLYTGLAGSGFTLGEAYLVTHDARYREGALQCVRWIEEKAVKTSPGVKWDDNVDIISGSSGTGLFLLWAADHLQAPNARELAVSAGEHVATVGQQEPNGGLRWMMESYPLEMPNFCHGTAGVAYFLATLYQVTGRKAFLDAALAGAEHLIAIGTATDRYFLLYHDDKNTHLYYLDWAHGPTGTAGLFYRLYQVTRDRKWLTLMEKCAEALVTFGGPEKAMATIPPGSAPTLSFPASNGGWRQVANPDRWDNVSMGDGMAGESEFLYNVYLVTHDRRWLTAARGGTDRLLSVADQARGGYRWVQVETFVRPDLAVAQTGYFQGAAGIGLWLLHFDAALAGEHRPIITLPDNPFPY